MLHTVFQPSNGCLVSRIPQDHQSPVLLRHNSLQSRNNHRNHEWPKIKPPFVWTRVNLVLSETTIIIINAT